LSRRDRLVIAVARRVVPAIYQFREFAAAGGLVSYGANLADGYRLVGFYAGRIIRGEKPVDLPVVQPSKFELVINLTTVGSSGVKNLLIFRSCNRANSSWSSI
jgi:putative ABC transport system substrate-binding protein